MGGCENRALHGCGTSYNYATLGPAFNAWQNMETCYPTGTVYAAGSLPSTSAGPVSQFTHTFATGANGYVAGNTIDPLENTTGAGGVDDVFQALTSGTSGANSSLTNNQPACLQYMLVSGTWTANTKGSCFSGTNPPSKTALAVTAASVSGTTATLTVSGVTLNVGALVTLSGFTWTGGNGNGTFAVTGAVGAD
ncbi:MAG TPA: hypothetical protein VJW96_03615 [Terriglobales bacterium]|nr:hypothetical protein [Terriglobales bacterium]